MSIPVQRLSDMVLNEPLSQEVFLIRKNLLLVSCITVLLTVYNIQVHELPWVKLRIEDHANSSNILLGALSVATAYFLFRFVISFTTDLKRWKHAGKLIQFSNFEEMARNSINHHGMIEIHATGKEMVFAYLTLKMYSKPRKKLLSGLTKLKQKQIKLRIVILHCLFYSGAS